MIMTAIGPTARAASIESKALAMIMPRPMPARPVSRINTRKQAKRVGDSLRPTSQYTMTENSRGLQRFSGSSAATLPQ